MCTANHSVLPQLLCQGSSLRTTMTNREEWSVVECKTLDQRVAGARLTGVVSLDKTLIRKPR